jgi:hypothetical protein
MTKGFWTHQRFMDVFVEVTKVQYRGPKYLKVKVNWWNKGQSGSPFPLGVTQTITINNDDLKYWSKI